MAGGREASDLAAIKAREAAVLAAIQRGDPEVDIGVFNWAQLGLRPVVADRWGRLWFQEGTTLVLVAGRQIQQIGRGFYDTGAAAVARNGDG